MDYTALQKLQQVLMPKQLDLQGEVIKAQAAGLEKQRDRDASMDRVQVGQAGQDHRDELGRTHAIDMARRTGRIPQPNWLMSLLGIGGEQEAAPAAAPGGAGAPMVGARRVLPNGIEVEWDGTGWAGVE
jgi:hypothetical protein